MTLRPLNVHEEAALAHLLRESAGLTSRHLARLMRSTLDLAYRCLLTLERRRLARRVGWQSQTVCRSRGWIYVATPITRTVRR